MRAFVMIPYDLEEGKIIGSLVFGPRMIKIKGNYDDVNRLRMRDISYETQGGRAVNPPGHLVSLETGVGDIDVRGESAGVIRSTA